jgi:hypothetical protein
VRSSPRFRSAFAIGYGRIAEMGPIAAIGATSDIGSAGRDL